MRFVVNKINCRQNETRLKLKARGLTFYSNNLDESLRYGNIKDATDTEGVRNR